jgi:hypothetical protein
VWEHRQRVFIRAGYGVLVARLCRTAALAGLLALAATSPAGVAHTRHVVFVTLDGVRVEEMFGGLDAAVLAQSLPPGVRLEDAPAYRRYGAPTREERRRRLMPFLWGTLLRHHGSIVGDGASGTRARVVNRHRTSYPGYAEMLTGRAQDEVVTGNDVGRNPRPSVLEYLRRRLDLGREEVALFASWDKMAVIAEHTPGAVFVDAGLRGAVRGDAATFELALAHLRRRHPRVLGISFDETDAFAHEGRYPNVLDALARADRRLERLWTAIEADPRYRGVTALVVTTDHGRGRTPDDWRHHGPDFPGSEDVWTAFVVPGEMRRGVWRGSAEVTHEQLAATLAGLLGFDFHADDPSAAPPVASIVSL